LSKPQIIAFHLPQYHRIPENDFWWGEGFTDWTNVRKAQPRYPGHCLPVQPRHQRYYDMLDPGTHAWQADLAKKYGIDGFCYYHYWFRGKQLLEKPCEHILVSGEPQFPFCFSWANESWTRSWDGSKRSVLMAQDYGSEADWKNHFNYLLPFFKDPRYITHEDCPLFLIYRPGLFPELEHMIHCWNRWSQAAGLKGVSFIKTRTYFDGRVGGKEFAASVNFEPWSTYIRHQSLHRQFTTLLKRGSVRLANMFGAEKIFLYSYDRIWADLLNRTYSQRDFPGAFVSWDNTPRRGRQSTIVAGSTPEKFGRYMAKLIRTAERDGSPFIFVNAWNEWAEGAYLEPDERHGYDYLTELLTAIQS
jgi:lipopolysaccharide biosynthesis protein